MFTDTELSAIQRLWAALDSHTNMEHNMILMCFRAAPMVSRPAWQIGRIGAALVGLEQYNLEPALDALAEKGVLIRERHGRARPYTYRINPLKRIL